MSEIEEFVGFPKMSRLSREVVITEKLDGSNASIKITDNGQFLIGSRKRWIVPGDDNYGFAAWATAHKDELMTLGVGQHFGEWWGSGIQRGYGLTKGDKRFSLFNVSRWCLQGQIPQVLNALTGTTQEVLPACCSLVPVLYRGMFDTNAIASVIDNLQHHGSYAVDHNFSNPEGIVIYHTAAGILFKKTIKDDETPKSRIKAQA